jgi:hypothetical protein
VVQGKKPLFQTRAELLRRLMLADVIARRGEGPLAPRFALPRARTTARAKAEASRTENEP